jgi:preprotein translocase subunit Sec63
MYHGAPSRSWCLRVLGVNESASAEDIRRAYRRLALQCHPDRNPGEPADRFIEISKAYRTLRQIGLDPELAPRASSPPLTFTNPVSTPSPRKLIHGMRNRQALFLMSLPLLICVVLPLLITFFTDSPTPFCCLAVFLPFAPAYWVVMWYEMHKS